MDAVTPPFEPEYHVISLSGPEGPVRLEREDADMWEGMMEYDAGRTRVDLTCEESFPTDAECRALSDILRNFPRHDRVARRAIVHDRTPYFGEPGGRLYGYRNIFLDHFDADELARIFEPNAAGRLALSDEPGAREAFVAHLAVDRIALSARPPGLMIDYGILPRRVDDPCPDPVHRLDGGPVDVA